tara:strand:+ start:42 stop:440 length:399 start_codon:yes stop_codon:yes gene_type:complete
LEYTTKPFLVRYSETDKMGIVHHSNYLKYFELGRLEWLSKIGISYSKIENDGIIMPVVNASLDYKAFAFFDDELTIRIKLITPPTSRIIFHYEIKNQNGKIICLANTTLCFLDNVSRKPIKCPSSLREIFMF